ncbi:MAG: hypothetical protein HZA63_06690 [Rhodocyclales bacterium]|nr:hypothetical protein [Rhodocyclales bacterium]
MASLPAAFTPAYKRTEQLTETTDGLACIAMISGKPITDVLKTAIDKFKLRPTNGPYFIEEGRLQILFAAYGYVASNWREVSSLKDLPDTCLVWQDTDPEMEQGRILLHHRMKDFGNPKQTFAYVIDPAPQSDPSRCILSEFADLGLTWFMTVTPMKPIK